MAALTAAYADMSLAELERLIAALDTTNQGAHQMTKTTNQTVLNAAASLLGDKRDAAQVHPEYQRAIVELVQWLTGGDVDSFDETVETLHQLAAQATK